MEPVVYPAPEPTQPFWYVAGECGLDPKGNKLTDSEDEYIFWLQLGITFLHHTFGHLPAGWVLDILWANAPHGPGKFPVIAIGFTDKADTVEVMACAENFDKALRRFNQAIDWKAISRSNILNAGSDV